MMLERMGCVANCDETRGRIVEIIVSCALLPSLCVMQVL